jgi:myo-inositol-1(or 4)-monophosphatase
MSSPNLHPMLNVAIKAARAAGAIINRAALDVESVRVSQKQVNDFVTEVDHASEEAIIDTLLTAYPGHAIWARRPAARAAPRIRTTSGSSTRWTAPPTSSTASRSTA